jgi:hypothetical protein
MISHRVFRPQSKDVSILTRVSGPVPCCGARYFIYVSLYARQHFSLRTRAAFKVNIPVIRSRA